MAIRRPQKWNPIVISIIREDAPVAIQSPTQKTRHGYYRENRQARVLNLPFDVSAQVNTTRDPKRHESRDRSATGDRQVGGGHILFRKYDLDQRTDGYFPRNGDRIVAFAGISVDFVLRNVRPESTLQGDFLLIYGEYEEPKYKKSSV